MIDDSSLNLYRKKLGELGLKEKESSVYLALLGKNEPVGSSKIIRSTGLHGQFVYDSLESLEEKGLVRHVIERGRKKFSANPPSRIRALVEKKRLVAGEVVEALTSAFAHSKEQSVEIYQGSDAIIAHEFEMLEEKSGENKVFHYIMGGAGGKFIEMMGEESFREYDKLREKKGIEIKYIGAEKDLSLILKHPAQHYDWRLFPGLPQGMLNTNIRPDSVTFNFFGKPPISITVKNKDIASAYAEFFRVLWEQSSRSKKLL